MQGEGPDATPRDATPIPPDAHKGHHYILKTAGIQVFG